MNNSPVVESVLGVLAVNTAAGVTHEHRVGHGPIRRAGIPSMHRQDSAKSGRVSTLHNRNIYNAGSQARRSLRE